MTPDEYYQQLGEERKAEWSRLFEEIDKGKHPTSLELADVVFRYGLVSATDAARYVARRILGEIKPPHKNTRQPRKPILSDEWLSWFYQTKLHDLQMLRRTNPKGYAKLHGASKPYQVAIQCVAEDRGVGEDRVRKSRGKWVLK